MNIEQRLVQPGTTHLLPADAGHLTAAGPDSGGTSLLEGGEDRAVLGVEAAIAGSGIGTRAAGLLGRAAGAHRAIRPGRNRIVVVAAAVATVLGVALGASAFAVGAADAAPRPWTVEVTGRVCGPGHPTPGWIDYHGNTGDHGVVRTGSGWYALALHRVPRGGEWVSGTAFCPAPRPMQHIRGVGFGFFVPFAPVVHRNIG